MPSLASVTKKEITRRIQKLLLTLFGATLYAASINLFVVPSHLYNGGLMGICQLIRTFLVDYLHLPFYNFDISGIIYYLFNIPIFLFSFRQIGKRFFAKTLLCVTWISIAMSMIPIPASPLLPNDILASCVIGGIVGGFGVGTMLKMGGSGGGMDIIGIILIKWKKNFSVGKVNLLVNAVLYSICLMLFDIPTVIYSLIHASVYSIGIDRVYSQSINVEVKIITKKVSKEMEDEIFTELGRGITKWNSVGAFTHDNSQVLYILMSKYEVGHLKHIIRKYDAEAFIVVNEGVNVDGNYTIKL